MTALGKLAVIMVFMLSLVWFGMTVNLFSTRTNWKAEFDKSQKNYQQVEAENKMLIAKYQSERDSYDAAKGVLSADRDRLQAGLTLAQDQYRSLNESYAKKIADERALDVAQTESLALRKKLQDELDNKNLALKKYEADIDTLKRSEQIALVQRDNSTREADTQKQRAESFADQVRTLSETLQDYKQSGALVKGNARPIAPEGFRGTVQEVGKEGEYLQFTPGSNTGLRPNTKLVIYREAKGLQAGKFLGYVIVTEQIDPDKTIGVFERSVNVKNPKPDDYPKKGDILKPPTQ